MIASADRRKVQRLPAPDQQLPVIFLGCYKPFIFDTPRKEKKDCKIPIISGLVFGLRSFLDFRIFRQKYPGGALRRSRFGQASTHLQLPQAPAAKLLIHITGNCPALRFPEKERTRDYSTGSNQKGASISTRLETETQSIETFQRLPAISHSHCRVSR